MVLRNIEVDFGDICIQTSRDWRGEGESLKVDAVPPDGVGVWILLKEGHYGRIGSGALRTRSISGAIRIHRGHICALSV